MHIFLDIDETLIHTVTFPDPKPAQYNFEFEIDGVPYYVKKRPGLKAFLKFVFDNFKTVSIWTAATRQYAILILQNIMTKTQLSKLAFFYSREKVYDGLKPLSTIYNLPLAIKLGITPEKTLIVDDKDYTFAQNKGNAILIPAWYDDKSDRHLNELTKVFDCILSSGFVTKPNGIALNLQYIITEYKCNMKKK